MLFQTILPALVTLVYVYDVAAAPQVTTVLPFAITDVSGINNSSGGEVFSGVIAGVGAGGETTYILSVGPTASDDVPVTVTLIEGASGGTAIIGFTDSVDGSVATQTLACGFQDGNADCTVAVVGVANSFTTTIVQTTAGPVGSITLAVSTSAAVTASPPGSTQSSGAERNVIITVLLAGAILLPLAVVSFA